jgi:hypothetical protein
LAGLRRFHFGAKNGIAILKVLGMPAGLIIRGMALTNFSLLRPTLLNMARRPIQASVPDGFIATITI